MRTLLLSLLLITCAPAAFACSCAEITLEESMKFWDDVLVGKVIRLEVIREHDGVNTIAASVEVKKAVKGDLASIITFITDDGCCYCSYRFDIGETYLLFAKPWQGSYQTNGCSRSKPVREATADLKALGLSDGTADGAQK